MYDSNGRSSLERESLNIPGVPMGTVPLSYEGREGLRGNGPAIGSIRRHEDAILQTIADLRTIVYPESDIPFDKLLLLAHTAIMYPSFFLNRADNPVENGKLSPVITGVHKAIRGVAMPLQEANQLQIKDRYARTDSNVDTSFIQSPRAYLAHVNEKRLLRSAELPGIGCPADEPLISNILHKLLDTPQGTQEEALERLGLTSDEANRLKSFGLAYAQFVGEVALWEAQNFSVSQEQYDFFQSLKENPLDVPQVRDQANEFIRRVNVAQRRGNKALGRDVGPDVKLSFFKQPEFTVSR